MTTAVVDSNAVTLLQATQYLNAQQRGWVRTYTRGYTMTAAIPMVRPNAILTHKYYEENEATVSNFEYRSINENPSGSTDEPLVEKEVKASFITSMIPLDYRLGEQDPKLLDRLISQRLSKLPYMVTWNIINGSSSTSSKNFIGMKEAVTGDFLIGPGSALTINADSASFQSFMMYWWMAEDLIIREPGTEVFAIMNVKMWQAIRAGILLMGADHLGTAYSDVLATKLPQLSDTLIHIVRNDDKSAPILPFTEASSTTSIYFIAISNTRQMDPETGEMPNGVFAVSDGVVKLRGNADGFVDKTYMELMWAPIFPKGSVVRLQNVKAA